ncbi:MAG: AEC family transporter [Magnetospirillum sp.]|nr:AEC family transporter [Magnetospirillum sp.]
MLTVIAALLPIFLLIALGWGLRHGEVLDPAFWIPAEKLTYFILFPALLLTNLAEARLGNLPVAALASAQALGIVAMAALAVSARGMLRRPPFRLDGPAFTSVFQGVVRPNTYVGLAAAAGLWGAPGVTLTAICVAVAVPLVNLLSVVAVVRWAVDKGRTPPRWSATLLPVMRNPLIAACLGGIALNASGIGLPPVIGPLLKILAQASLPLGLLAVGAGLDLRASAAAGPAVALTATVKLVLLPALVAVAGRVLGLDGLPLTVCAVYAGLPAAPNAYILARQLGGDFRLMAAIITATTVAAIASLPLLVAVADR